MSKRIPLLALGLATVAGLIHWIPGAAAWLDYDRAALGRGEWWRFASGHLTHFDRNHLLWDVGMFFVLGSACERESRRRTAMAIALAMIGISGALWFGQPQFHIYRGLSGVDSALFGLLAARLLHHLSRTARVIGVVALLAIGAKFVFEFVTASTVFASGHGYVPVPLAHLIGLLAGIVSAVRPRWPACFAAFRTAPSPGR